MLQRAAETRLALVQGELAACKAQVADLGRHAGEMQRQRDDAAKAKEVAERAAAQADAQRDEARGEWEKAEKAVKETAREVRIFTGATLCWIDRFDRFQLCRLHLFSRSLIANFSRLDLPSFTY